MNRNKISVPRKTEDFTVLRHQETGRKKTTILAGRPKAATTEEGWR